MRTLKRSAIALLLAAQATLAARTASAEPKREMQDYGAPKEPTDAGDVAIWVPRVTLFPLWLVSEYVIRQPVGALVRVTEREQWPQEFVNFFTFGDRRQVTIFPSALFDFGLKPSVGFNAQWKYFLAEPNTISLHFGTWGPDWIATRAVDTYQFNDRESVSLDGSFVRRKDLPFYGMGPRSSADDRLRYQTQVTEASVVYTNRFWRSSEFSTRGGFRALSFGDGTCCGDDSIASQVQAGNIPLPPGFGQDYQAAFGRLSLAVDNRLPRPNEGGGVRVEAHAEGVSAPSSNANDRRTWVKYGGSVGAAVDLTRQQRVLAVNLNAEFADPLQGTIPFTDQVSLGGERLMRGYLRDRLIDRSSVVATLQYTWPVWVFLDGVLQADVGNVFGEHLDGFDLGLMRLSSGIGVRSTGSRDSGFELLVAGGTDPFEEGFHVSSFRLVIGSHHGF